MSSVITTVLSALDSMTVSFTDQNSSSATPTTYNIGETLDSVQTAHLPCRLLMMPTANITINSPGTMSQVVYTINDLFLLEATGRGDNSAKYNTVLLSYMTAYQDAIAKLWQMPGVWQTEAIVQAVSMTPGHYIYPASSDNQFYGVMVVLTIAEPY